MSYRLRISFSIILSTIFISGSVLLWAYQNGKVVIFGSQQKHTVSKKTSGEALDRGNKTTVETVAGQLKLTRERGMYSKSGTYVSEVLGGKEVLSFNSFEPEEDLKSNLIKNADFEEGINNWQVLESGAPTYFSVVQGTQTVGNVSVSPLGEKMMKVSNGDQEFTGGFRSDLFPLEPSRLYLGAATVRAFPKDTSNYSQRCYVKILFYDTQGNPIGESSGTQIRSSNPSDWNWPDTKAIGFASAEAKQGAFAFYCEKYTGTVFVENAEVYQLPVTLKEVLVKNSGFENGATEGWKTYDQSSQFSVVGSEQQGGTSITPFEGSKMGKLTFSSPVDGGIYSDSFDVTPGKVYLTVGAWQSYPKAGNTGYCNLGQFFFREDGTTKNGEAMLYSQFIGKKTWSTTTAGFGLPTENSKKAAISVWCNKYEGTLYLDKFAVYEINLTAKKINLINPDFEKGLEGWKPYKSGSTDSTKFFSLLDGEESVTVDSSTYKVKPYGGSGKSLKISKGQDQYIGGGIDSAPFEVTPGKIYLANATWRTFPENFANVSGDNGRCLLEMLFYSNKAASFSAGNQIGAGFVRLTSAFSFNSWYEGATSFLGQAPRGATKATFTVWCSQFKGSMYLDNIQVYELSEANLIESKTSIGSGSKGKITYQFRGSQDGINWSSWSAEKTPQSPISLAGLIPTESKYLQVKANFSTTDAQQTPVLSAFVVSYDEAGIGGITGGGSEGQKKPVKLIASGSILWFNLVIALAISGIISYLLISKKSS